MKEHFPEDCIEETSRGYALSFGAFERMEAWIEDKMFCVDTESNLNVEDDEILDTNKRFRDFLEDVTGYTAKQRVKKAKEAAKNK